MAKINMTASKRHKDSKEAAESESLKILLDMSPKEAAAWIENSVNTPAEIKKLLKTLTKAVIALTSNNE